MKDAVETIVQFFQALSPQSAAQLSAIYAENACFKDPFNEVRGLPGIQRVFRHMYVSLDSPRFIITDRIVDGRKCFLTWEFRFAFRRFHAGVEQCIVGGSQLLLDDSGRIVMHRDYWDAAEELYEKLPVVGGLMRWLKRRANA
ncbi:MAG: nuclear transport factor 2 family protein [Rhodoferax sp.]